MGKGALKEFLMPRGKSFPRNFMCCSFSSPQHSLFVPATFGVARLGTTRLFQNAVRSFSPLAPTNFAVRPNCFTGKLLLHSESRLQTMTYPSGLSSKPRGYYDKAVSPLSFRTEVHNDVHPLLIAPPPPPPPLSGES